MEEEQIEIDPLFKGLTRPPMKWGVGWDFLFIEGITTALLFMWTSSFWIPFLIIPVHAVGWLASIEEPRVFSLVSAWVNTTGKCLTRRFWGGSSYDPLEYGLEKLDDK